MAACLLETFGTDPSPSQQPQAAWCRAACRIAEDPQPGARPRGTAAQGAARISSPIAAPSRTMSSGAWTTLMRRWNA